MIFPTASGSCWNPIRRGEGGVGEELDYEWLMMDASYLKVHPHAAGARGGNQTMSRTKGAQHETAFGRGCAG